MSTDSQSPVLIWFRDDHHPIIASATTLPSPPPRQPDRGFYARHCRRRLGWPAPARRRGSLVASWIAPVSWREFGTGRLPARPVQRLCLFAGREGGAGNRGPAVFWNRRYGAAEITLDSEIKKRLTDRGIRAHSFNGRLLHEPWEISNQAAKPFQVFTPNFRAVMARKIAAPLPAPKRITGGAWPVSLLDTATPLEKLGLEPSSPDWAAGIRKQWQPGEQPAQASFARFLRSGLNGYASNRDRPSLPGTSRLSPHLRFGEIGPGRSDMP